ncbi:MAG: helix-turn-helix domain-containing protein [Alphaproteobacteria bacterium]|nr:helix-turn-helix domain-containing protein [Alphaproteobacteria bacterium]
MSASRVESLDYEGYAGEMTIAVPPRHLQGIARRFSGYLERSQELVVRRQPPHGGVPLIISFGPRIDIGYAHRPERSAALTSFVAGLHDVSVLTSYCGHQHGLQIDLTPLGAYRVLGVSMAELTNRTVAIEDVVGPSLGLLRDAMAEVNDWSARFALAVRWLGERAAAGKVPHSDVAEGVAVLMRRRGHYSIARLASDLAVSRPRLIRLFRDHVGLPPKTFARVLRFSHAEGLALTAANPDWAQIAATCGYADQSHLIRDFRALADATPGEHHAQSLTSPFATIDPH